jgi:hypothetical protein
MMPSIDSGEGRMIRVYDSPAAATPIQASAVDAKLISDGYCFRYLPYPKITPSANLGSPAALESIVPFSSSHSLRPRRWQPQPSSLRQRSTNPWCIWNALA